jgi:hypothetical protein
MLQHADGFFPQLKILHSTNLIGIESN